MARRRVRAITGAEMKRFALGIVLALAGCSHSYSTLRGDTSQPRSVSPGEGAVLTPIAAGVAANELARQPTEEIVLGWNIKMEGGMTRWRECTSAADCTTRARSLPSEQVLGFANVGRAQSPLSDEEIDVVQIRLKRDPVLPRRP